MRKDPEESVVVEEAPAAKQRLPLVVTLAVVLGALLVAGVGAAVLQMQSNNALRAEVLALKNELKEKSGAHEEAKALVEALSRQIEFLKDNAVARSNAASDKRANDVGAAQIAIVPEAGGQQAEGKETPATVEPAPPPRVKKPKSDKPNCELIGKTKEEQEETLKRCVSLIDLPK